MNIKFILFITILFTTGFHINGMKEYQRPANITCLKQIFELDKLNELADNITNNYDLDTATEAHQSLIAAFKNTPKYSEKQILYAPRFNQFTERLRTSYTKQSRYAAYSKDFINRQFPMMEMPAMPGAQSILAEKRSSSPVRKESEPKRVRSEEPSNNLANAPAPEALSTELQKLHNGQKEFAQLFTSLLPRIDSLMGKLDAIATKVDGMDSRIVKLENRFKN